MGPRAGLDDVEKRKILTLPALELRRLGCPARSQSLYRLRYPGSRVIMVGMFYHYMKYRIMHASEKKREKILCSFTAVIAARYMNRFTPA
jgi:hypothetical protein